MDAALQIQNRYSSSKVFVISTFEHQQDLFIGFRKARAKVWDEALRETMRKYID